MHSIKLYVFFFLDNWTRSVIQPWLALNLQYPHSFTHPLFTVHHLQCAHMTTRWRQLPGLHQVHRNSLTGKTAFTGGLMTDAKCQTDIRNHIRLLTLHFCIVCIYGIFEPTPYCDLYYHTEMTVIIA